MLTHPSHYDAMERLTQGSTCNDAAQDCTTQLGYGNYHESYSYSAATGNLAAKAGVSYTYNAQVTCAAGNRTIAHAVSTGANNCSNRASESQPAAGWVEGRWIVEPGRS